MPTKNRAYINKWRDKGAKLCAALGKGFYCYAFDPYFAIAHPDGKKVDIEMWLADRIIELAAQATEVPDA